MLQIFIIENDDIFRKTVNKYVHQVILKQDMKAKIIYSGKNITEFMKALKSSDENSFNLYFLDIDLDDGDDGITLSREIRNIDYNGNVVFITGHEEYARKTLEFNIKPLDYVVKGNIFDVKKNIDKCIKISYEESLINKTKLLGMPKFLSIKNGLNVKRISVNDILYVETVDRKLIIYTETDRIEFNGKLKDVGEELDNLCDHFFCCHRSFIVNTKKIKEIRKGFIELKEGTILPLARMKTTQLKKIIGVI